MLSRNFDALVIAPELYVFMEADVMASIVVNEGYARKKTKVKSFFPQAINLND